jgi:hypothetical protein
MACLHTVSWTAWLPVEVPQCTHQEVWVQDHVTVQDQDKVTRAWRLEQRTVDVASLGVVWHTHHFIACGVQDLCLSLHVTVSAEHPAMHEQACVQAKHSMSKDNISGLKCLVLRMHLLCRYHVTGDFLQAGKPAAAAVALTLLDTAVASPCPSLQYCCHRPAHEPPAGCQGS